MRFVLARTPCRQCFFFRTDAPGKQCQVQDTEDDSDFPETDHIELPTSETCDHTHDECGDSAHDHNDKCRGDRGFRSV